MNRYLSFRRWLLTPAIGVVAVTAVGALLRLYRLGHWALEGDEIFTLRDSLTMVWLRGPRPLLYFLNHHLVASWTELDELSLRILPVAFGIISVPVVYAVVRRTMGTRAGLLAAILVAVHPWHLNWSQYARYYSLVFLLSMVFPSAVAIGLRRRQVRWLVVAVVAAGLAILAHPASGLAVAAVGVWVAVVLGLRIAHGRLPGPKVLGGAGIVLTAIVIVTVFWLAPILRGWTEYNIGRWGHVGPVLVMSYLDWLLLPFVVFAGAGLAWLWRDGDRFLAGLHACVFVLPVVFLAGVSPWVSVSTGYLIAATPPAFALTAYFLDRLWEYGSDRWTRRLLATTCMSVVLAACLPRVVAQYQDGGRLDYRAAARHVEDHWSAVDRVLTDQLALVSHYLPAATVEPFSGDHSALDRSLQKVPPGASLWVIAPIQRRGGFRELNLGAAEPWITARCRLSAMFAVSRLDYKYNEVRVYRCPK